MSPTLTAAPLSSRWSPLRPGDYAVPLPPNDHLIPAVIPAYESGFVGP